MIAKAMGPQNTVGAIGIMPRIVEMAVKTMGRNRALFEAQAKYVLETAQSNASCFGVLLVDLDGFKLINDGFGHAAGDKVLTEVAMRLTAAVGDEFLARLGGDDFGIVTWIGRRCREMSHLINDLELVLKPPFDVGGGAKVHVSASIGAALYPDAGNDLEMLLTAADESMYGRKRAPRRSRSDTAS
jgi:diguanylate cyclase (GGDEF)-like protein